MSVTHHQLLVVGLGLLLACVLEATPTVWITVLQGEF
jgi:hypothetical protein